MLNEFKRYQLYYTLTISDSVLTGVVGAFWGVFGSCFVVDESSGTGSSFLISCFVVTGGRARRDFISFAVSGLGLSAMDVSTLRIVGVVIDSFMPVEGFRGRSWLATEEADLTGLETEIAATFVDRLILVDKGRDTGCTVTTEDLLTCEVLDVEADNVFTSGAVTKAVARGDITCELIVVNDILADAVEEVLTTEVGRLTAAVVGKGLLGQETKD